jgi:hypothetical protein
MNRPHSTPKRCQRRTLGARARITFAILRPENPKSECPNWIVATISRLPKVLNIRDLVILMCLALRIPCVGFCGFASVSHARALTLALMLGLAPALAAAQTDWELSPYRVRVLVAVASRSALDQTIQSDVRTTLAESAHAVFGATWELKVRVAGGELRDAISQRITSLRSDLFAADWEALDKVLVVGIDRRPGGFHVVARDFDCQTRMWSPAVAQSVRQTALLPAAVFRTLLDAYAPLSRIEFDEDRRVVLRPRAGSLPLGDPSAAAGSQAAVFLPVLRHNDRDGNPRKGGIQAVPWTLLIADQSGPSGILCSVQSGLRSPLRARLRGRIQQFALPIKTPAGPTHLLLRDRIEPDRPLAGYLIYARDPGSSKTVPLGRTDVNGAITIPPGPGPLRTIYVRNGASLLARLPMVPGWQSVVTALIPDDDARIRAEGFLTALQSRLMDVVARREILMTRVRHLMQAGDLGAAKQQLDQLQGLPNRQRFLQEITQQQQRDIPSDPQLAARVERLFEATKQLLTQFLDPRKINQLQSDYDRARRQAAQQKSADA